jgi:DNA-binding MurR/RpiR family transcriptional regulator
VNAAGNGTARRGDGARRGNGAGNGAAAGAPDYDALAARLAERFPSLPRQLQRIATYALESPEDFALGTAAQLATAIGVQPSALVRFANALDFDGFAGLRAVFRSRLVGRAPSYRERIAQIERQARGAATGHGAADAPMAVLDGQVRDALHGLDHLARAVDADTLDRAVDLIARAPHLHLIAAKRSFPVASYLAYALNQLERRVTLLDGVGGMNREFAARIGRDEVLVAVSFRNYTPEIIEIAHAAHARGVRVIAFTDSPLSPLARAATLSFVFGDDGRQPFRSLVEPIVLAQALVIAVGHRLVRLEPGAAGTASAGRGAAAAGRRRTRAGAAPAPRGDKSDRRP